MENFSFWGRKDKVISGILQGSVEAGRSQVSVTHSTSELWGLAMEGQRGEDGPLSDS